MSFISRSAGRLPMPLRNSLRTVTSGKRLLSNNSFYQVSEEVREALHSKKPVVALETTIYTHGFPYPENVALASLLESVVRANGGVPATIGIIDGVARIGLEAEELILLASSAGKENTMKLSRRDLSYALGMRLAGKNFNGGTTIASTMLLAHLAGIKVFGTGGLGGVHRGAESSMDVSADLTELGRTPVAVVSSGCKSFLDIGRTLEYLETEGVGVCTFADGREGKVDFPAFWSRDSGIKSPVTIQNEFEAAAIIHAQHSLQISSGLLFANPVPVDAAIPKPVMDEIIKEAISQANAHGISGKDNTPFILNKIKELSNGASLPANRALIESNVRRATIIARELAILESQAEDKSTQSSFKSTGATLPAKETKARKADTSLSPSQIPGNEPSAPLVEASLDNASAEIVVAGALAVDISCDFAPLSTAQNQTDPAPHTSNPAIISQSVGGVAHNIAKAAHLIGSSVRLCSTVGNDLSGQTALQELRNINMRTDGICILQGSNRTAQYVSVNNAHKDLAMAMADMSILETSTPTTITQTWLTSLTPPKCLIVDANWAPDSLHTWLKYGARSKALTIFEPVSTAKSTRLFAKCTPSSSSQTFTSKMEQDFSRKADVKPPSYRFSGTHIVDLATPNTYELTALHDTATKNELFESSAWFRVIDALGIPMSGLNIPLIYTTSTAIVEAGIPQQAIKLLPFIPTIFTKLGAQGVLLTKILAADDPALSSPDEAKYVLARNSNEDKEVGVGGLYVRLFPVEKVLTDEVVSVNGCGDTFIGVLAAGLIGGREIQGAVGLAQRAAGLTLRSRESVSPELKGLRGEML